MQALKQAGRVAGVGCGGAVTDLAPEVMAALAAAAAEEQVVVFFVFGGGAGAIEYSCLRGRS